MSDWISVKDKIPISGDMILISGIGKLSGIKSVRQGFLSKMDDKTFCDFMSGGIYGGESNLKITHWMTLPPPPKEKL